MLCNLTGHKFKVLCTFFSSLCNSSPPTVFFCGLRWWFTRVTRWAFVRKLLGCTFARWMCWLSDLKSPFIHLTLLSLFFRPGGLSINNWFTSSTKARKTDFFFFLPLFPRTVKAISDGNKHPKCFTKLSSFFFFLSETPRLNCLRSRGGGS